MKLSSVFSCLLATTLSTLGMATILIDLIPSTVHVNDTREIIWSTDQVYDLELHLVQQAQDKVSWRPIQSIFNNSEEAPGNSGYNWTVPSVAPSGSYALWISGQDIPNNGSGYANLTNWFQIEGGHGDASSGHSMSTAKAMFAGQIAGLVVGIVIAVSLIAAAVFVLRRRALRKAPRVSLVEAHPRESFDSIMNKKAEIKLAKRSVDV